MRTVVAVLLCLTAISAIPWPHKAEDCNADNCAISAGCRCASTTNPIAVADAPQLIVLTFDEAVVNNIFLDYWQPLLFDRLNPDGKQIGATFFVPHEYTDYARVRDLYVQGFEIGVNSITKNVLQEYWRNATVDTLVQEFDGQRTIISNFANIPKEHIVGARTPQLQLAGDTSILAYTQSEIQYDNSWTTRSNRILFPYTLDYLSTQECTTGIICPVDSHPGFWIAPITNVRGSGDIECNSLVNCFITGSADEIATWLMAQVDRVRNSNKAPLTFLIPSSWFLITENSHDGFVQFLDTLAGQPDVFLVSQRQAVEWTKNPVPLSQFTTDYEERSADCEFPINCNLEKPDGDIRYMNSCVPCPPKYPWLGNPFGEDNPTDPPDTTTTDVPPTTDEVTTPTEVTTEATTPPAETV